MSGKDTAHFSDPQTRQATVTGLSMEGAGVARLDGQAIFVPCALPGDEIELRPDFRAKPPTGKLLHIMSPSPDRIDHPCPHASQCPASPLGHLKYDRQLELKTELVARTLAKTCGNLDVRPMLASPSEWHYRNRISIRLREIDGGLQAGYSSTARSTELIRVRQCRLAHESLEPVLSELQSALEDYRGGTTEKFPVRIQLHMTSDGPGALVVFPLRIHGSQRKLWRKWLTPLNLPGGIWFATGNRAGSLTAKSWIEPDEGAAPLETTWRDQSIKVHPGAFCQANAGTAELVHRKLQDWAAFSHGATVWDLYGGYGALGFAAAMRGNKVKILESTKWSERTARRLAESAGVLEVEFVLGDVRKELRRKMQEIRNGDLLILDPPRSGVHLDVLESVIRSSAKRIAYLSCNPAKLGRDLGILMDGGFQVGEIQPVDFFPQTASIEVLAFADR